MLDCAAILIRRYPLRWVHGFIPPPHLHTHTLPSKTLHPHIYILIPLLSGSIPPSTNSIHSRTINLRCQCGAWTTLRGGCIMQSKPKVRRELGEVNHASQTKHCMRGEAGGEISRLVTCGAMCLRTNTYIPTYIHTYTHMPTHTHACPHIHAHTHAHDMHTPDGANGTTLWGAQLQ